MTFIRSTRAVAWTFSVLLLLPVSAHAYVDPNAGGLIYQLLFPIGVAIAGFWAVLQHKARCWAYSMGNWIRQLRARRMPKDDPGKDV